MSSAAWPTVSEYNQMTAISIDNAVKLAKIMGRIKSQVTRKNNSTCQEFVREIALLQLPTEHVRPLLDEIHRRGDFAAHSAYRYDLQFFPPHEAQALPQADKVAPDTRPDYDDETGEGCVRYQDIDLGTALNGPIMERVKQGPWKEGDYIDPRRVRGFPFAEVFAKLKIANRTQYVGKGKPEAPNGIYIKPWHPHEPGEKCCYAEDAQDDSVKRGTGTGYLGCEREYAEEPSADGWNGTDNNAFQMLKYLEAGLITLDEIKSFCYGFNDIESPISFPDPPDGIYPDAHLALWILAGVEAIHVCSRAYPIADVIDEHGKPHGRQLRYWDGSDWKLYTVEWRALESEGVKMFQELSDHGLPVNSHPAARSAFRNLVKAPKLNKVVTQYSRPGWHGHDFVLPTGFALSAKRPPFHVAVAREGATVDQTRGGTHDAWIKGVSEEIWRGDCPQFAMGQLAGMCGVLSSLLLIEHPVIHFSGPSSSGKSTAQVIAAGMTANPAPGQGTLVELQQDVESVLPKGVGTACHIDDPTKHGSPTTVERLMYRAMACCPFTVSSVAGLELIVERAGGKMDEGIRRRVLTVDTRKMPRIDPFRASDIKAAALANYGHAAPWFVDHVLERGGTTARADLLQQVRAHAKALPGDMTDSETVSAAVHIGLLQLTGELMIGAGLIDPNADITGLLLGVWNDWLERKNATPVNRAVVALEAAQHDAEALGCDPDASCWVQEGVGFIPADKLPEIIGEDIEARHVLRHLKETGRLVMLGKNMIHNRLPGPDGRELRHYRVRLVTLPRQH